MNLPPNYLEDAARSVRDMMRAPLTAMPEERRAMTVEMMLGAIVSLCAEHMPPAEVAAKLRALADAIEEG